MRLKVYIFGNPDEASDNKPFLFLDRLMQDFKEIEFVTIVPNQDLPVNNETGVVTDGATGAADIFLIDTIDGIDQIKILDESFIDKFVYAANSSVHDYDLGFQLKYLKKLGKINKIKILGIPMNVDVDYDSFHSSFKKFVAQDMQGS